MQGVNLTPCTLTFKSFARKTSRGRRLFFDLSGIAQSFEQPLHRGETEIRMKSRDLRFGEFPDPRFDRTADGIKRRPFFGRDLYPFLKITVRRSDRAEQIFDKRRRIVLAFTPLLRDAYKASWYSSLCFAILASSEIYFPTSYRKEQQCELSQIFT